MKWLILLGLLVFVFVFIALRFRRQIQTGIDIWRIFKQFKNLQTDQNQTSNLEIEQNKSETLVRCVSCGNWIAESKALNLRSKNFYCSSKCVEKSVAVR